LVCTSIRDRAQNNAVPSCRVVEAEKRTVTPLAKPAHRPRKAL
jgi:hypothetical protein